MNNIKKISKVTVVDSIMGSGKTSWAIQHMKENPDDNFLYITPYLDEVQRIIDKTERDFKQPINKGNGKLDSLNGMIACQEDIAFTHELFKHLDENSRESIKNNHYTLILDEVLEVITPYNDIRKDDIKVMQSSGLITVNEDGFVNWNKDKMDYDTKYNEIKMLADNHSLLYVKEEFLVWRYSPEIFRLFDKIYIMTYLFEVSVLKNYLDAYGIGYDTKSVINENESYKLVDYFVPDTSVYASLINIYDGTLNTNIRQKQASFSATWFKRSDNKDKIKQLKNNLYNYLHNIVNAKSDNVMWTTFKDAKNKLKGKGYTNQFVSCNCRSTNEHSDKYNLAYCLNIYVHPAIIHFFREKGIEIDQNLYALSEMIQWIWRSRIRIDENINIYIPSARMRRLLNNWLNMTSEYKEAV
ncbi:MAG: DEAD/DEAH box helicase family protein [Clostridiales bacterium]|nr:DEAD/DEAH box helicase family protein [Clostridiales bacterium]